MPSSRTGYQAYNPDFATTRMLYKNGKKNGFSHLKDGSLNSGGLRAWGFYKKSDPGKPLITVITVSFNCEKFIEQTIKSVIGQTYDNVEYIIVDGGSTDKTVDIIKRYDEMLDLWTSGPDNGVYDAMNNGIRESGGSYLLFLNADDYFLDKDAVSLAAGEITRSMEPDIVYGRTLMADENRNVSLLMGKMIGIEDLKKGITIPHPSSFIKKDLLVRFDMFNRDYKIAADFDFFCRCIISGCSLKFLDRVLVFFRIGGLSGNFNAVLETASIIKKYFGFRPFFRYKTLRYSKEFIRRILVITGLIRAWRKIKSLATNLEKFEKQYKINREDR